MSPSTETTMTPASGNSASREGWHGSRFAFMTTWLLSLVAAWFVLRVVLLLEFLPAAPAKEAAAAILNGLGRDALVALWMTVPVFAWLFFLTPQRGVTRFLFWAASFLFWFAQIFLLFVEYFFFDEFRSRFNTVAVDYLQYPNEVFVNIWQSYHVAIIIGICLVPALVWIVGARLVFAGAWEREAVGRWPVRLVGVIFCLGFALAPIALIAGSLAGVITSPLRPSAPHVSSERSLNEIANNGEIAFLAAALTHHLEYSAFYKTLPRKEAYERARFLLSRVGTKFVERPDSLCRTMAGDPARPQLNVVILLEESFGSEFWGCLGRRNTLTPEMDKLAATEGILFTNLYASGNRTVRGMEGVLASFPPLPGESIVKREFSDHVESIARLLKRDGYSTVFLYGGRGVFDGMRSFCVRNGYDRFIEQKHFERPTFTTVWGVCDEDLYRRSIDEFRELSKSGKPFFATVLSVSNHKPYTYPRGKILENPDEHRRENAVKYSDYALGQFFRLARQESFWTNTIFAVVADHGARVYGEQSIPIHSYEIPLLIAGPAVVDHARRVGELGCSLDVAPTLLGLIGRPYQSTFFGQDLLKADSDTGRALLNHNRDIGLLARQRLIVLGLMKTEEFYAGNPKLAEMKPLRAPGPIERELETDAMALFQVADDLYTHQRYRVDEPQTPTANSH